jgi:hypothetical protein
MTPCPSFYPFKCTGPPHNAYSDTAAWLRVGISSDAVPGLSPVCRLRQRLVASFPQRVSLDLAWLESRIGDV